MLKEQPMHELLLIVATGRYGSVDVLDAVEELVDMGCTSLLDKALAILEERTWREAKDLELLDYQYPRAGNARRIGKRHLPLDTLPVYHDSRSVHGGDW